jgi:hypothetical protein
MRKSILLAFIALIAISCSQTKQTALTPTPDEVHRYSTVYEGNRILKYDIPERKTTTTTNEYRKVEPIVVEDDMVIDREPIESLPSTSVAKKNKKWNNGLFPFSGRRSSLEAEEDATQSGGGWVATHPGTFAIILYGGAILFFWIPFLAGLLGLAALVFAIIGVVKKTDQTDFVLAWIVLGLFILGLLLVFLAAAASV